MPLPLVVIVKGGKGENNLTILKQELDHLSNLQDETLKYKKRRLDAPIDLYIFSR